MITATRFMEVIEEKVESGGKGDRRKAEREKALDQSDRSRGCASGKPQGAERREEEKERPEEGEASRKKSRIAKGAASFWGSAGSQPQQPAACRLHKSRNHNDRRRVSASCRNGQAGSLRSQSLLRSLHLRLAPRKSQPRCSSPVPPSDSSIASDAESDRSLPVANTVRRPPRRNGCGSQRAANRRSDNCRFGLRARDRRRSGFPAILAARSLAALWRPATLRPLVK